ncbi:MAG TPA: efflux RND transporter periplasmic adaptor subunit [Candidatus Binataceae bacterium]|nr:efflux RND transporter periplasmic adaptor subunit [Candidatus Binataceae bacterium]
MRIPSIATAHCRALALALLALIVGAAGGCGREPKESAATEQPAAPLPHLVQQSTGPELMQLTANQLPGLTITEVIQTAPSNVLETSGQVTFDDRRVSSIISRVSGRIEEVRVSQWDTVRRGQSILTLYSPDFMTAEAEYLQAKLMSSRIGAASDEDDAFGKAMVEAAIRKLALLGIEPDQIATIKSAAPTFTMRAPISGTVVENKAVRGAAVNPGDALYSLGTLDKVWITGDIYEDDLARVKLGQPLEAVTMAYPDRAFKGVVARISPAIDPNTHTAQIRCEISNPDGALKPQMLARVKIVTQAGTALIIPEDALIFETDSYYVYVEAGENRIERRKIAIGSWNKEGFARVLSGLKAGDHVVTGETIQVNALWHEAHADRF